MFFCAASFCHNESSSCYTNGPNSNANLSVFLKAVRKLFSEVISTSSGWSRVNRHHLSRFASSVSQDVFFLRFLVWHCKAAKCTGVRLIGKKEIVFKGMLSTWCFWKHAVADIQQRVSTNQSTSSFFVGFFSLKFLLMILHRWFGFISSVSD